MRTLESFNVLESFGFESDVQGLFSEVSEVEMIDVIGGGCGGGCGGPIISCECWGYNYGSLQGGK
jgi:hypothetical protein